MADARYFTTINGAPVRLQPVGYFDDKAAVTYKIANSETGKRVKSDRWHFAVGRLDGNMYFADRVIFRKANASNHKCDSRCTNAKGHNCECSCGGKNHGKGD